MRIDDGALSVLHSKGHLGRVVAIPFVKVLVLVGDGDVVIEHTGDDGNMAKWRWPRHRKDQQGILCWSVSESIVDIDHRH